ncbi:DNA internalization-related competence protein ComEC/Rec2 [hydrothermal vent metagenome]|uniref:DNA internalization-related competence protein ComEC/Rec2 n=1 Tax=hydrothermal vent metagenome TaxID=652676 RepID=A0A3B0U7A2_9ZZZZ
MKPPVKNAFHTIPFLRILAAYIFGIVAAHFIYIKINLSFLAIFLVFLIIIALLNTRKTYFKNRVAVLFITLFLIGTGFCRYRQYNKKPILCSGNFYVGTLLEMPAKKSRSFKAELLLSHFLVNGSVQRTKEKVIAYFQEGSLISHLSAGKRIMFKAKPAIIYNPGNPFEFDYKGYLEKRRIYRQVYIPSNNWRVEDSYSNPLFSPTICAERIRGRLISTYRENNIVDEKFAILSALTLGYKEALGPDVKSVFSSTGAMHVLAVSGLHVGIIYLIINFLLGFLKRNPKGRVPFICLAIAILWSYALITGLSPSVQRAATMFSIVIIGENLRRPANIYNTLASSAFLLLVINPNLLSDVGFQLSYSAVFGIVFFQPGIYKLFSPKYWLADKAWALFSVSVAAQITTFPFILYYFNQYPTYSILSNFIVIPAAFIFIFLGFSIIVFSFFPVVSNILAIVASGTLGFVYEILKWIQSLPGSSVQNIHLSGMQFVMLCLSIIMVMVFISSRKPGYFISFLVLLALIMAANLYFKYNCLTQKKIIVYNSGNNILIHLISGGENFVVYENGGLISRFGYEAVNNVITNLHLKQPTYLSYMDSFDNDCFYLNSGVISFYGKQIVIGSKLGGNRNNFPIDIIILQGRVKPGLLKAKHIVTYHSFANENKDIVNIKKDGAFVLEL